MTNFEKWKQELTMEDMSAILLDAPNCRHCPAQRFCCSHGNKCGSSFKKWANSTVEEEEKR